eukprot:5854703-Ditylum_brightwellii.AAC.1
MLKMVPVGFYGGVYIASTTSNVSAPSQPFSRIFLKLPLRWGLCMYIKYQAAILHTYPLLLPIDAHTYTTGGKDV